MLPSATDTAGTAAATAPATPSYIAYKIDLNAPSLVLPAILRYYRRLSPISSCDTYHKTKEANKHSRSLYTAKVETMTHICSICTSTCCICTNPGGRAQPAQAAESEIESSPQYSDALIEGMAKLGVDVGADSEASTSTSNSFIHCAYLVDSSPHHVLSRKRRCARWA